MQKLVEQIVIDIIQEEMDIDDQNIWIRSQNRLIPNDDQLYIVVGVINTPRVMSSQTYMEQREIAQPDPTPPIIQQVEVNRVNTLEEVQVDIVSKSNDAIFRRWEVLAAIRSFYSQQQQEANYFKIFRMPSTFINASEAEGGSQLNRYTMTIPCFVWYKKEKVLDPDNGDYYDDFHTRVDDEKTIGTDHGIIEFEISGETIT